jgi:two-component system, chemotaxis family, CheB/CheR fusion protein
MSAKAARKNLQPEVPKAENTSSIANHNDTTIVAIGASAGGIEALTELMNHLATNTGMAFVLVQHLDPKHHSILTELLGRKTSMTVTEVMDGLAVKPNHVYVIPPNATMSISGETLHLSPREESAGMHMSVDHFMRALAEQKGNRAVGVILSGSGTDGTLGMSEIQAHGGVTFAQDEATAQRHRQGTGADRESSICCAREPFGCGESGSRRNRGAQHYFSGFTTSYGSGLHALPANDHIAAHPKAHGGA